MTTVTAELAARRGTAVKLIPMSDDPVRTRVTLDQQSDTAGEHRPDEGGLEVAFQDYFVRLHHDVAVRGIRFHGAEASTPAPGVIDALTHADLIVCCPSNPLVSIAPILAVPGIRETLITRRDDVVAVSPIVAGSAIKGPADRLLGELGHEVSVVGIARLYADWVGTLVIDQADAALAHAVEGCGLHCVVADTIMSSVEQSTRLAKVVCDAGR